MSSVRCRRCGELVPRDQYAQHIPCKGYPHDPPSPGTAEADHFPQRDPLGWGSLLAPGQQRAPDPPAATAAPHKAPRLGTARGRVLALLDDLQWHTAQAITDPAVGGSEGLRRMRELRARGYSIDKRRATAGVWEYRLTSRCSCHCPTGPCTHRWQADGTCTRCGAGQESHDMLASP